MLVAVTIAERRNITPAVQLTQQLASNRRHRSATSRQTSSKYHMDMNSRRLPPPLVLYSDSEKDAWIKNRNEQSRLDKVLDHLNIQEQVFGQLLDKEGSVVRRRSSKFQERAKAATAALRTLREGYGEDGGVAPELQATTEVGIKDNPTSDTSQYYSYQIETKQGTIRKTVAKPAAAWGANRKGILEMLDDDADDSDDDDMSFASSGDPANSSGSVFRPFTANAGRRPASSHHDVNKRRVTSAFPVSKLPKVASNSRTNESSATPNRTPRSGSKSGGKKSKSVFYCPSRAEDQLKQELQELRKRRQEYKPHVFDFSAALERERDVYSRKESEMRMFYDKVNDMKKVPMSKWELKNVEARLKLW